MIGKVRQHAQSVLEWARRTITQPRGELDRWERAARFAYDLGRHGARQLRQDRAAQMGAALAYRTLFGLLPVLVVTTVVARALMGPGEFMSMAGRTIEALNLHEVRFTTEGTSTEDESGPLPVELAFADPLPDISLGEWLEQMLTVATRINLTAIGWIGLLVLIYAAIGLMVTIENSFNRICRAPEGRPWMTRVLLYWFVLTISPIAIGLIIWFDGRIGQWIEMLEGWQKLLSVLSFAWSFVVVWLLMTAVYTLLPNTSVSLRSSIIGAFVSAVGLLLLTRLFGLYLERAVTFTQLYGSLGLIPLFMLWVYIMWLVVLFGLEVASTLQTLRGRSLEEIQGRKPPIGLIDPGAVLAVMEAAAERFREGGAATVDAFAERSGIADNLVEVIVERLVEEKLLHKVSDGEDAAYALARPPESIEAERLLRIGFSLVDESTNAPSDGWIERLRSAQIDAAAGHTLARAAQT